MDVNIQELTYEESRMLFFESAMQRAQKRYYRLEQKYKNAPYASDESVILSDAGIELSFYRDIVTILREKRRSVGRA